MRQWILASFAALAIAGAGVAEFAFAAPGDAPAGMTDQRGLSPETRAALFEARIAGMKAALKLTPEQEKAWAPFETAVRTIRQARLDAMKEMRDNFKRGDRPSPIERMNAISERLAKASTELKQIADAAAPLYGSLDDTQKQEFGPLLRTLRAGHRRHDG